MLHADEIRIDNDEGRITLVVEHDEGTATYDIHSVALGFYDEVRRELGPYVREAEWARTTMPADDADAYEIADPKHPRYSDVWSELPTVSSVDMDAVARLEAYAKGADDAA